MRIVLRYFSLFLYLNFQSDLLLGAQKSTVLNKAGARLLRAGVVRKPASALPNGMSLVDWQQIRAEYERNRHAAFADNAGVHARNFRQQWLTQFDGRGFS